MTESKYGLQPSHRPSLETLPTEIMLQIMYQVTDLDGLYNLIRASPTSSRIFNDCAHEIMEAVLPMCPLKIEIQHLVRAVILARSSALPLNNLHEFKMLFQKRTLHTDDARRYPPLTLRRDSLEAASLEAIRLGLATACRISVLTYTCLEFYLGRLRDKSICNPHHCGNRQYPLHIFLSNTTHSWTRSVGKPVRANYARSPSWVEEMRVARVLWMMQLVGELRHLAMRDPDALGWPQEDVEQAIGMMPEAFATSGDCYFVGMEEEAITVCEYLHTLDDEGDEFSQGRMESFYRLPRPPEIQTRSWTTQEPKPCMRKTTLGYVYDLGNRFIAATPPIERLELLIRPPPAKLPPVQGSWFSGQQSQEADRAGPGVEGYKQIAYDNWETPLSGVQFDSFRRLGFALWDDTRMRSLRLMDKYNWRLIGAPQIFVWRSLLSEEEIALAAVRFEPSNHGVDAE